MVYDDDDDSLVFTLFSYDDGNDDATSEQQVSLISSSLGRDSRVVSVAGSCARGRGFDNRRCQKCWAVIKFVNIYHVLANHVLKFVCVCCFGLYKLS